MDHPTAQPSQAQATLAPPLSPDGQPPSYTPIHDANLGTKTGLLAPLSAQSPDSSASSSNTAINPTPQVPSENITAQPTAKAPLVKSTYDSWNPADASNKDGRPVWWNRWFCCGYGVGCVLCLCGSPTCWQERQKQGEAVAEGAKRAGEAKVGEEEKRV
ncbi:uncharacterized protein MKK02DRAFT_41067 [Dioszegia hungarica]|uniref:Uncharacterized protein n=1 Tax=Dioszegia hungarica TaxID=4972 RepID=A0AA38LQ14_9TREE|nr:uncharacterized protein MKK02DRAFT_41067 [Dioszegia hungarica]KAI9632757.1 hypothetical protein MKK02DRAFT_41067 [Dioszegia hungarica]